MKKYSNMANLFAIVIITCCFVLTLTSCEKTYTKEQTKIEKYLSERNFDKAREVALTIPSDEFYYKDMDTRVYYQQEAIDKINKAQLSLLIADNMWYDAEALSHELNADDVFFELFTKNLNKLLRSENYSLIFTILSTHSLSAQFFPTVNNVYFTRPGEAEYNSGNFKYNKEVQAYNSVVDGLLNALIMNQDKELLRKCIQLYKKEAVQVSGGEWDEAKYALKDNARKNAQQKIKDAGIKL